MAANTTTSGGGGGGGSAAGTAADSNTDATTTTLNFRDLYEINGDSNAALMALSSDDDHHKLLSPEADYNRHLLEACCVVGDNNSNNKTTKEEDTDDDDDNNNDSNNSDNDSWLHALSEKEAALNTNNKKRKKRDDWIISYNKSLVLLTQGKTIESIELVWEKLGPVITGGGGDDKKENCKLTKDLTSIACRMSFLVLEGILTYFTVPTSHDIINSQCIITLKSGGEINHEIVVKWLSKAVDICSDDPSLKFQLTLYKGRLDFLERKDSKLVDARVRSCRKELKHAMEIFQHKLRPSSNNEKNNNYDSQSIASSVGALSTDNSESKFLSHASSGVSTSGQSTTATATTRDDYNQNEKLSRVLQTQNSAALNLKANTEQLKGNIKKSLILLAEASPTENDTTSAATTTTTTTTTPTPITTTTTTTGGGDEESKKTTSSSETKKISNVVSSSTTRPIFNSNYYESLHYNNLGIVYNTSGKKHLALLAWSKAMSKANNNSNNNNKMISSKTKSQNQTQQTKLFEMEGTACLDVKLQIYYNSAIGSIQVQNYDAAYQCLSSILSYCLLSSSATTTTLTSSSHTWHQQPKVWLRLSEACIGIGAKLKKEYGTSKFSKIPGNNNKKEEEEETKKPGEQKEEEEREPAPAVDIFQGILLDSSFDKNKFDKSDLDYPLGSEDDWEYVQKNPYTRARWALEIAIALFEQSNNKKKNAETSSSSDDDNENSDPVGLSNAHLSLAYVCLEQSDFKQALQEAEWVLNNAPSSTATGSSVTNSLRASLIKRQLATARMYASEAACALGKTTKSLQHLVGDGKEDAFDRLASDLAGVTLASASKSSDGKSRLAKAQASVRCSASIASCELGNLTAAKQLAMSAQAMEAASQPRNVVVAAATAGGRDESLARRALVYCNLRERQVQEEQQRILMQQQGGMQNNNSVGSSNTSLTFTLMRSSR